MADQPRVVIVLTTVNTVEHAETLARTLLEERLIACSTAIPTATSHYWWGDTIVSETETFLLLKTDRQRVEQLIGRVAELHPYTVPEIIVLEPTTVNDAYGAWVIESTQMREN
jgi:periplasmic divalent cation tolerance protein